MFNKLCNKLSKLIPMCWISVSNSPEETSYCIDAGQDMYIDICSRVAYTGTNTIYARYEIFINDELVVCAQRPISLIDTPSVKNVSRETAEAEKIEQLMRMCSQKILKQETISQRNHMLKNLFAQKSEHIH